MVSKKKKEKKVVEVVKVVDSLPLPLPLILALSTSQMEGYFHSKVKGSCRPPLWPFYRLFLVFYPVLFLPLPLSFLSD